MRVRDESEDEPKDVAHSGDGDAAAWCAMATDRCVAQLSRHAVFGVRASSRLVRQLIPTLSVVPSTAFDRYRDCVNRSTAYAFSHFTMVEPAQSVRKRIAVALISHYDKNL